MLKLVSYVVHVVAYYKGNGCNNAWLMGNCWRVFEILFSW